MTSGSPPCSSLERLGGQNPNVVLYSCFYFKFFLSKLALALFLPLAAAVAVVAGLVKGAEVDHPGLKAGGESW